MSYIVIIRGSLGVGKSTVAKRLVQILHGIHISMDVVLEKHRLDKIKEASGCVPIKNFIKANNIILPEIKAAIAKGKIVVIDGCFYHNEQIDHIITKLSVPQGIFTLKAPLDICIKRDAARKKSYGRSAAAVVHYLVSKSDLGVLVDTHKKTVDQTVREILSKLPPAN